MFPSVMPGCRSLNNSRVSRIELRCLTAAVRVVLQHTAAAQLLWTLDRRQARAATFLDSHHDLRIFALQCLHMALHRALMRGRLDEVRRLDLDGDIDAQFECH